jgi:hypothetical protein
MGDHQAAQAVKLVCALRHQLHEMTTQLARVERQDVIARNGRACAMRMEAAALRRDIQEAQFLIDPLQRRYLNGDERTQQHPAGRQTPSHGGPTSQVTRHGIDPVERATRSASSALDSGSRRPRSSNPSCGRPDPRQI